MLCGRDGISSLGLVMIAAACLATGVAGCTKNDRAKTQGGMTTEFTLEELQVQAHDFVDCNGNGIPDGQDIQEGTAPDENHNGLIDLCDIDTDANYWGQSWREWRAKRDTSYFSAGHRWNR